MSYYTNELNKITGPARLQICDEEGNITKWIDLNDESRAALIEWLTLSAPKSYSVSARRWRDINGNTYHTVTIYENGKELLTSPVIYGYGRQYSWTALKMLQEEGKLPRTLTSPIEWERDDVIDVKRKKDL